MSSLHSFIHGGHCKSTNLFPLFLTGVRVLLGVDGTKLTKHPILGSEKFSKIIFNFPHIGGKMKIHLNRNLLRDFFKSASSLLEPGGHVMVSLCKGQGGTAADIPLRRWDDTWQIVEMAAHADLILSGVVPFHQHLVPNYSSVGYRSRDSSFHTDGALVHIFSKVNSLYPNPTWSILLQCLEPQSLETKFGKITCPSIYVDKYNCNPADIEGTPVHYLHQKLKAFAEDKLKDNDLNILNVKHISDMEVPLHVESYDGSYLCEKEGQIVYCELRHSLLDVISQVLPFSVSRNEETRHLDLIFSGLVFNKLGPNFSLPPLSNHVLILGSNICSLSLSYIQHMLAVVEDCSFECSLKEGVEHCETCESGSLETSSLYNIVLSSKNANYSKEKVIVGKKFSLTLKENDKFYYVPCSLIYLDKLAHILFKLQNWRELWAESVQVVIKKGQPLLKLPSLYPRTYTFDICFASEMPFNCKMFYDIMWQVAGDIITNIELLNLYESPNGWNSSCYRIVYKSFDKALYREKVVAIHQNIIGKIVCEKMGVSTN